MALVTVQRSPSVASSPQSINSDSVGPEEEENARANKSLSECYFAGKGTALVLGSNERLRPTSLYDVHRFGSTSSNSSTASSGSDIQQHLQLMFYLLRPEETLKMAVKLESARAGRTRYLVVVSRPGRNRNQLNTPASSSNQKQYEYDLEEQSVAQQYRHSSINKLSSTSIKNNQCSSSTTLTTATSTLTTTLSPSIINNRTNISIVSSSSGSLLPQPSSSASSTSTISGTTATTSTTFYNNDDLKINQLTTGTTTATEIINNNCGIICDDYDDDNNYNDDEVNQKFSLNNFINNCDNDLLLNNHQEMKPIECFNNKLSGMCSNYCDDDAINDDVMMMKNNFNNNSYNNNYNNNKNKLDNIDIDNNKQYSAYINSNGCESEESCLLGIDCNETTTVGLVLKVLADTSIRLDGDGGFSVSVCGRTHIFKPVSVQAMWSALQTLHKVSSKARENNYYAGGPSHEWVSYYEDRIESDRSCLNEWNAMDSLESRRPPSPDTIRNKPTEREETERVIRTTLKEIMMSVDLDEVTSKYIRGRLEEHLDMDLGEFKSFIDEEMLIILGQMDAPTEVFDHVYLGSEWNASNLEELQRNGVRHILNVTREIDNFFPGMFDYFNVRVYDDEKTNLLKHWDNTFKYINRAKMEGSKVLVHCKMGISRSASVVIAYAMKAYNWDFEYALKHVKEKRNCIKPNKNFISQLETYQGMLDAMKNKEKLQRSKSETNLKSTKEARLLPGSEPTPLIQALNAGIKMNERYVSGRELKKTGARPKSWSPDNVEASVLLPKQQSQSLENLGLVQKNEYETTNVRLPFSNGLNYSVSQNQAVHLQEESNNSTPVPFVKSIVNELESNEKKTKEERKSLNLNLNSGNASIEEENDNQKDTWDPGENKSDDPLNIVLTLINNENTNANSSGVVVINKNNSQSQININTNINSSKVKCDNNLMWTSSAQIIHQTPKVNLLISENKENTIINRDNAKKMNQSQLPSSRTTTTKDGDLFSAQLDRVFDREERKQNRLSSITSIIPPTVAELSSSDSLVSRQSSSSSVDSAVVLGYLGDNRGDTLSRHSSWGSGDTRTTPSRNSSWGSYDMRNNNSNNNNNNNLNTKLQNSLIYQKINPDEIILGNSGIFPYEKDEIPWHAGTVKRTKQKIEERNAVKRICSDNKLIQNDLKGNNLENEEPLIKKLLPQKQQLQHQQQQHHHQQQQQQQHKHYHHYHSHNQHQPPKQLRCNSEEVLSTGTSLLSTYYNRLSVSAPETSEMCFNLRCNNISNNKNNQNVNYRSKFNLKKHYSIDDTDKIKKDIDLLDDCQQVLPGIVKNLKMNFEAKANTTARTNGDKKKVRSLPSSPVALHMDTTQAMINNSCNKQIGGGGNVNTNLMNTSGKSDNLEDINVKGLVDRYEVTKMLGNNCNILQQQQMPQQQQSTQQQQTVTTLPLTKQRPRSCYYEKSPLNNYQTINLQMPITSTLNRPPVPPPTSQLINKINCMQTLDDVAEGIVSTDPIITTAAASAPTTSSTLNNCNKNINNNLSNNTNNNKNVKKVQQHGKTHPLAKLGIPKQSINTVAYNTM